MWYSWVMFKNNIIQSLKEAPLGPYEQNHPHPIQRLCRKSVSETGVLSYCGVLLLRSQKKWFLWILHFKSFQGPLTITCASLTFWWDLVQHFWLCWGSKAWREANFGGKQCKFIDFSLRLWSSPCKQSKRACVHVPCVLVAVHTHYL